MRTLLLTLPFILMADAALAQARPNSLTMSCASVQALIQQRGGIVIGSGPDIFDRFVSSARYCMGGETTDWTWVRTRDVRRCPVFRCQEIEEWMIR
jgi:hypothetical protein